MAEKKDVIQRVVERYNKTAKHSQLIVGKARFSDEEKQLLKSLAARARAGEFGEKRAATLFRKEFAFRSHGSVRWRMRKELGKRVVYRKPKRNVERNDVP